MDKVTKIPQAPDFTEIEIRYLDDESESLTATVLASK